MNHKLILEMVRDRRIAIDDALILLDLKQKTDTPAEPKPPRRRVRRAKTQNVITVERHFEIVRLAEQIGGRAAARRLGLPAETVANHLRYAGVRPCTPPRLAEVQKWRERRNLYLDRPIVMQEAI